MELDFVTKAYDLGVSLTPCSVPGSHELVAGCCIRTGEPGVRGFKGLLLQLYCCFWASCLSPSLSKTFWSPGLEIFGKLSWNTRSCNISAGDGSVLSAGVVRRHSMAKYGSPWSFYIFCRVALTILAWLSIKPFDLG